MVEMNRRELAAALLASSQLRASGSSSKYAVVGAGVFGAWTAYHLRRAGHQVVLLDQYGPANGRSSSGGETRIIRAAYGPDEIYTRMAWHSLTVWTDFFAHSGRDFFRKAGVLWTSKPGYEYAQQSREMLRKVGVPFEDLSADQLKRRYPQMHVAAGTTAIFEPNSGALMAREAVESLVTQFVKDGGEYKLTGVHGPQGSGKLEHIETTQGEKIQADAYVFACGSWLGKVFPELLGHRIFPTMQEVLFFGIAPGDHEFEPEQMPVWIDFSDDRGMYGFPDIARRGFKVAFDHHGPPIDPDRADRFVRPEKIREARAYVAERFPALAHAPIIESRVCPYENTSNGDFVIDRHPALENVWIAGGGSGHGYKHGPAVGEYVAARVTGAATPAIEPRFSLATKKTEQHRSVV